MWKEDKSYPSPFTTWHNLECVPSLSGVTLQPGGCGVKAGQDDRVDDRSSIDRLSELFNGCKCVVRPPSSAMTPERSYEHRGCVNSEIY